MEFEWKRSRTLGPRIQGHFDSFLIIGSHYETIDDGEQGWYIESKPIESDFSGHESWVAGEEFKSIRQQDNRLLIGERLVAVNSGEASTIIKAFRQWEHEEPEKYAHLIRTKRSLKSRLFLEGNRWESIKS